MTSPDATRPRTLRSAGRYLGLCLLLLGTLPFVLHAIFHGLSGLTEQVHFASRLFRQGEPLSNLSIFGHMLSGAVITFLAPLQLLEAVRKKFPGVHRWSGRIVVALAFTTGVGGLMYIAVNGTIGGAPMNVGFALYGVLLIVAASQTIRHARRRTLPRHRRWALRLLILCIGSWIYRVHYHLWSVMTDGAGSRPTFDGPFDQVQNFAFYLPYLLLLEVWMRRPSGRKTTASSDPA